MSYNNLIQNFENYRLQLENIIFSSIINPNILMSQQYRLWYYINENVKYDFYYLYSLDNNKDYSSLGFPVAYRNIRSSMESFYDLICFNKYPLEYLSVCKFQINIENRPDLNIKLNSDDYKNLNFILSLLNKGAVNKVFYYINLENKAKLASKCTTNKKIITEIETIYEPMRKEANKYAHSPLFILIDSDKKIGELLNAECHLLCYSFIELYDFLSVNYQFANIGSLAYNELTNVYKNNNLT